MSEPSALQQFRQRDGTSQADRQHTALDPDYIAIDERSMQDLLAFARAFAKELRYVAPEQSATDPTIDWRAFLGDNLDLDEIVAFMQEPSALSDAARRSFGRPHFVLFLTFLLLLRHAQNQLNTLTRRHLDFYYQQVLAMVKKESRPDTVNVLVDLVPHTAQFYLPAGTLLDAGTDSLGEDLVYQLDQGIVASHAQIAQLSTVYADTRVTGIQEARAEDEGTSAEALMRMLAIALGDPDPGDPLPPYLHAVTVNDAPQPEEPQTPSTVEIPVTYELIEKLRGLIDYVQQDLNLSLDALRQLMRFKRQRDHAQDEWDQINAILTKALQTRTGDLNAQFRPDNPRDFDTNLQTVLATDASGIAAIFSDVTEVDDIYDAYALSDREDKKADIAERVKEKLFLEMADFTAMMQVKVRIDGEWDEINRILADAHQTDGPFQPLEPTTYAGSLEAVLGTPLYPNDIAQIAIATIDELYAALREIADYFFLSLENFSYIVSVAAAGARENADAWAKVDALLADAYRKKVVAAHRVNLTAAYVARDLVAMARLAVGATAGEQTITDLIDQLKRLVSAADSAKLDELHAKLDGPAHQPAAALTDEDWNQLYRIAQIAQSVRIGRPVAQKIEWLNLYPTADATANLVELGIDADANTPRWKTFGRGEPEVSVDALPPAEFGWAISSPLLLLSQGERTITLILGFQPNQPAAKTVDPQAIAEALTKNPFRIQLSTAKGWVELASVQTTFGTYADWVALTDPDGAALPAIRIAVTIPANVDAITPLPAQMAQIDAPWPILRVMLRQQWTSTNEQGTTGRFVTHYQPFKPLRLMRTHLHVAVAGLVPQQLQNDETTLNPAKPFEPFGIRPVAGARLYFSHPELIYKELDSLRFDLQWMGVPDEGFKAHYRNYPSIAAQTFSGFTAQIGLVDNRLEVPITLNAPLFADSANQPHSVSVPDVRAAIEAAARATERPVHNYTRTGELAMADDLLAWNRAFFWELNAPDFQHEVFPALAAQKSVELAAAIATEDDVTPAKFQVNPPYTPKLKSLRLTYESTVETNVANHAADAQFERIYHIEPFGYRAVEPDPQVAYVAFLPQYDFEGELYIGIRDIAPPQNLAILFQMAEGSADPDLAVVPIQWSYLNGNRWVSLDNGDVLSDTTRGLINSGIINFALPPARPNTRLAPELYWIRAAIPHNANGVCDAVALHTQAVAATFVDQGNAADHLQQPLPAESITDLAATRPEISRIRQPYTSFGGKMAEADHSFYTRISERLRHKQRALTPWDYEHMILERFPEIYKVKCLPASHDVPGEVTVIVIPDIRNKLPFNPFEPKAPANLIVDIESFLTRHLPAFASVQVKNAHYVAVKVRFAVRLLPEFNEGYVKQRLNEEINHFLAPWAYDEGADIVIGGRIYANVLINFIEERPYVDYVAQIRLFHSADGDKFIEAAPPSDAGYWVETDKSDGVLVAARTHDIDIIADTGYEAESFEGIGYMKIELDFIVG